MKIHLRQIPAEGLHLEGEEDCPIPELEADGVGCAGPLQYDLEVGLSANALWASGSLRQPVKLSCVSCLEPFVHEIKVPAFALHKELQGPEIVDLAPFIREDLLLNLPAHPRCDREGNRVCKGAKLHGAAADKQSGPITEPPPAWDALDKLKLPK